MPIQAEPAALISLLPLDVIGGGERFTLDTHASGCALGRDVSLYAPACFEAGERGFAGRMQRRFHRLERGGDGVLRVCEQLTFAALLERQADFSLLLIHQYLADTCALDLIANASPWQALMLTGLGFEPARARFLQAFEPHPGVVLAEISDYAAARMREHGVDASAVRAGLWSRELKDDVLRRSTGEAMRVVSVGRLLPHKGFEVTLEAVAGLGAEARLDIIGGASGHEDYERLLRAKAQSCTRLHMHGVLPDAQRQTLLNEADVLVASSTHRLYTGVRMEQVELFGLVLLEAVAAGALPIASDIPSFREIAGELGLAEWLYPERDVGALQERLRDARQLGHEGRAALLADARTRMRSRFLWEDYWQRLERLAPRRATLTALANCA